MSTTGDTGGADEAGIQGQERSFTAHPVPSVVNSLPGPVRWA